MAQWNEIDVRGDGATQWSREIEELNENTETLLKEISQTLQSIESSGTGQIIENLVNVANGCVIAFDGIIGVAGSLAEMFVDIIQQFGNANEEITQDIDNVAASSFKGGGKSINSTHKINVYSR